MAIYRTGKPAPLVGKEAFKAKMKQIAEEAVELSSDLQRWSVTLNAVAKWNLDRYLHTSKVYTVTEYNDTVTRLLKTPCPVTVADIATQWFNMFEYCKEDKCKITRELTKCIKQIRDAHRDIPVFLSKVRADGFDD